MKHLKKFNEESSEETMQDYVENYLSYLVDSGDYNVGINKKSVSLRRKSGDYVSFESEPDLLTFIDLLSSKHDVEINFTAPDADGSRINRGTTPKLLARNTKVAFSDATIIIK